jgi:uncharacterized protein with PQ loop repeat
MIISNTLSYFGATCGTIAVIPQIIRVIKLKEANALSYLFLGLRMIAFFSFMIAIALTGHYFIASSYIMIIGANMYLAYLKYYYSKS